MLHIQLAEGLNMAASQIMLVNTYGTIELVI
jgi:hypothetical protein